MPDILTIDDIMQRYRCSRDIAKEFTKELPFFIVANKRFYKLRDLQNMEEKITHYPNYEESEYL